MAEDMVMEEQEAQAPEVSQKDQAYINGLMAMIHNEKTAPQVVEMLGSAPPEQSIPQTAITIFKNYDDQVAERAGATSLETKLIGGTYVVQDLVEIGNAAGLWDLTPEEAMPVMEDTMQKYIEMGLKDGSIDPVELQTAVEPLMDDGMRAQALEAGAQGGIPAEANEMTAMENYGRQREMAGADKEKKKGALRGGGQ